MIAKTAGMLAVGVRVRKLVLVLAVCAWAITLPAFASSEKTPRVGMGGVVAFSRTPLVPSEQLPEVTIRRQDGSIEVKKALSIGAARVLAAKEDKAPGVTASVAVPRKAMYESDYRTGDQWYLPAIKIEQYWDASPAIEGDGIKVAIVDSGIDWKNHVDFHNSSQPTGYQVVASANFTGLPLTSSKGWHGTHVAGIIGAARNGQGIVGVAPEVDLMDVRVLDAKGDGSSASVAQGVRWAKNNGAKIIVLALGGEADAVEELAIEEAEAAGILVFAAGGNTFDTLDNEPSYPGGYDSVIAVAAVDQNNAHAKFSTINEYIDIAAPGVRILSDIPGNTEFPDGMVAYADGTSMATPMAAGMAANIWAAHPTWTAAQVKAALFASAQDVGDPGVDSVTGVGVIRPESAAALQSVALTAAAPAVNSGTAASFTATVTDSGGPVEGVQASLFRKESIRKSWTKVDGPTATDSAGHVAFSVPAGFNASYLVVTETSAEYQSKASNTVSVTANAVVTSNAPVIANGKITLTGRVRPTAYGTYGLLELQKWYSGSRTWARIGTLKPDASGNWTALLWAGTKAANFRVVSRDSNHWGFGTTPIITLMTR